VISSGQNYPRSSGGGCWSKQCTVAALSEGSKRGGGDLDRGSTLELRMVGVEKMTAKWRDNHDTGEVPSWLKLSGSYSARWQYFSIVGNVSATGGIAISIAFADFFRSGFKDPPEAQACTLLLTKAPYAIW